MKLDEVISKLEECGRIIDEGCSYGYGWSRSLADMIEMCEKLKALGIEWGETVCLPHDFDIVKNPHLSNPTLNYQINNNEWYILWGNGRCGQSWFAPRAYWDVVQTEWREFQCAMLAFGALDYDLKHDRIIYNIENGKKVIESYADLCKRTQEAMNKKVKAEQIRRKQAELAKLMEEE